MRGLNALTRPELLAVAARYTDRRSMPDVARMRNVAVRWHIRCSRLSQTAPPTGAAPAKPVRRTAPSRRDRGGSRRRNTHHR